MTGIPKFFLHFVLCALFCTGPQVLTLADNTIGLDEKEDRPEYTPISVYVPPPSNGYYTPGETVSCLITTYESKHAAGKQARIRWPADFEISIYRATVSVDTGKHSIHLSDKGKFAKAVTIKNRRLQGNEFQFNLTFQDVDSGGSVVPIVVIVSKKDKSHASAVTTFKKVKKSVVHKLNAQYTPISLGPYEPKYVNSGQTINFTVALRDPAPASGMNVYFYCPTSGLLTFGTCNIAFGKSFGIVQVTAGTVSAKTDTTVSAYILDVNGNPNTEASACCAFSVYPTGMGTSTTCPLPPIGSTGRPKTHKRHLK